MKYNAIVYMIPDVNDYKMDDWLGSIVGMAAGSIRENVKGVLVIVSPFEDPNLVAVE